MCYDFADDYHVIYVHGKMEIRGVNYAHVPSLI